jgi:uncharacterized SAM-binding protein YcdF (DUF218 family)
VDTFQSIAEVVKTYFVPGSFTFLLFGLTLGVALLFGPSRTRRLARPLLAILALGYWTASLPAVSDALATRLHARDAAPVTAETIVGAQAIVVLGSGIRSYGPALLAVHVPDRQTVWNAFEGGRVFRLLEGRAPVIVSGGIPNSDSADVPESVVLRDLLVRAGVPLEQVILESASRTTHEQALQVVPMLKAHGWTRFVLIAPPVQMPRALAVFAAQGARPIPADSPVVAAEVDQGWRWVPNGGSLRNSERAAYDYLAWGYYWLRGWL